MNRIRILISIIVFAIVVIIITPRVVSPILRKKILSTLNQKYPDYEFTIEKLQWSLIPSEITLKNIAVSSMNSPERARYLKGEISNIKLEGVKYYKALVKNEYEINDIIISEVTFQGSLPFKVKEKNPIVSSTVIHIDNLLLDQINISLKDSSSAQTYTIRDGDLKIMNLEILQNDTIGLFKQFDFNVKEFLSVSADSMYTYRAYHIAYSDTSKILSVDTFLIDPNYKEYEFTSKYTIESDRFFVVLNDLNLYHFNAADYLSTSKLIGSYLSIGKFDMEAFRDKRKKDNMERKPTFQEYIYNYPGFLKIDSVVIGDGNVLYTEHAEKANEPGRVNFNKIKASIYNLTNDSIYKTKDTSIFIKAEAMLMGKGKMNIHLKAKLFDSQNTFSMKGTLASFDVKNLNPILEKNAFLYANSARVNKLDFNFIANNNKATGKIIMLYKGLDIAVKNKRTEDTTAIKERFISLLANVGAYDSNPLPSEEVRIGIIDYESDPTKFIFKYCVKLNI